MMYIYILFPHFSIIDQQLIFPLKDSFVLSCYFCGIRLLILQSHICQNFMCCAQQCDCSIIFTHQHVPFLMNWTYYAIFPLMVWSLPLVFLKWVHVWPWALFPFFNQFSQDLIMSSLFSIFQFTDCHLCVYIIW